MIRKLLVLGGLGALACIAYAAWIWSIYYSQDDVPKYVKDSAFKAAKTVETIPLVDGLYMLRGEGGNVTVSIGNDGILVVDTDMRWMTPKIRDAIRDLAPAETVAHVINTHSHEDHRGGNALFRQEGAEIIAHTLTRENIVGDLTDQATVEDDYPTITFETHHSLNFNGETIILEHVPNAHTNGDIYVHFTGSKVFATGDVYTSNALPFISRGAGATFEAHVKGQRQILDLDLPEDTIIVPGHGPRSDLSGLADMNERLGRMLSYLKWLKSIGIPKRALMLFHPAYPIKPEWRSGHGWEKFVTRIYYDTL